MFNEQDVANLARVTPSPVGRRSILESSISLESKGALAVNPTIAESEWLRLWELADSETSGVRERLMRVAKTLAQMDAVLNEPDANLIANFLKSADTRKKVYPELGREICEKLLASDTFTDVTAAGILATGYAPSGSVNRLIDEVLRYTPEGGYAISTLVRDAITHAATLYSEVESSKVIRMLEDYQIGDWNSMVVDLRPELIPLMRKSPKANEFYKYIAAARHLFEPEATALLNEVLLKVPNWEKQTDVRRAIIALGSNPNVSFKTRADALGAVINTDQTLDHVAGAESFRSSQERQRMYKKCTDSAKAGVAHNTVPWELAEGNDILFILEQVLDAESGALPHRYISLKDVVGFKSKSSAAPLNQRELSDDYLLTEVSPRLDVLGPNAWSVFVSMLSGWHQSIEELIDVVSATAK